MPTEMHAPQAVDAVDRDRTDGSSTPTFSKKKTLITTSTPAITPMSTAAQGSTNAQGAVIATRPASMPLHIIVGSGLRPFMHIMSDHAGNAAPVMPAKHGVHHDEADAQVGAGQRRARVKAEPTEGQDERSEHDHRHVVARHRLRLAIDVFADARANHHRARQAR